MNYSIENKNKMRLITEIVGIKYEDNHKDREKSSTTNHQFHSDLMSPSESITYPRLMKLKISGNLMFHCSDFNLQENLVFLQIKIFSIKLK